MHKLFSSNVYSVDKERVHELFTFSVFYVHLLIGSNINYLWPSLLEFYYMTNSSPRQKVQLIIYTTPKRLFPKCTSMNLVFIFLIPLKVSRLMKYKYFFRWPIWLYNTPSFPIYKIHNFQSFPPSLQDLLGLLSIINCIFTIFTLDWFSSYILFHNFFLIITLFYLLTYK